MISAATHQAVHLDHTGAFKTLVPMSDRKTLLPVILEELALVSQGDTDGHQVQDTVQPPFSLLSTTLAHGSGHQLYFCVLSCVSVWCVQIWEEMNYSFQTLFHITHVCKASVLQFLWRKKNAVFYVKHYQAEKQNPPTRGYKTHFLMQSNFHTKDGTISWATSPRLSFWVVPVRHPPCVNSRNNPTGWELPPSAFLRWGYGGRGRLLGSHGWWMAESSRAQPREGVPARE